MLSLKKEFGTEIGLSDHSLGHSVAIAATALGARVIEKHFALDREENSIDGGFSMLPEEFKEMTTEIISIHSALGNERVYDRNTESKGATFKRSILVSSPVKSGDLLTKDNIRVARPGDGCVRVFGLMFLGQKLSLTWKLVILYQKKTLIKIFSDFILSVLWNIYSINVMLECEPI